MAITNPEAIRFVNEQVRPLCEKARALSVEISAMKTLWFGGLDAQFPNDTTGLDDGRDGQGVSRLTGAQVQLAVGVLIAMLDQANAEIIAKPCVRPLSAS